jgi:hypothetical protein
MVGTTREFERMPKPAMPRFTLGALAALSLALAACATVHVKVDPINIYAKLDADVRIKLDREVQTAIQQNPNLF